MTHWKGHENSCSCSGRRVEISLIRYDTRQADSQLVKAGMAYRKISNYSYSFYSFRFSLYELIRERKIPIFPRTGLCTNK